MELMRYFEFLCVEKYVELSITPMLLAEPAIDGFTTARKKIDTETNYIIQNMNEKCNIVII